MRVKISNNLENLGIKEDDDQTDIADSSDKFFLSF